jgi:hypothetical protein
MTQNQADAFRNLLAVAREYLDSVCEDEVLEDPKGTKKTLDLAIDCLWTARKMIFEG